MGFRGVCRQANKYLGAIWWCFVEALQENLPQVFATVKAGVVPRAAALLVGRLTLTHLLVAQILCIGLVPGITT